MKKYSREWQEQNGIKTVADFEANLALFSLEADCFKYLDENYMDASDYGDDTPILEININLVSRVVEVVVDTTGAATDNGFAMAMLLP